MLTSNHVSVQSFFFMMRGPHQNADTCTLLGSVGGGAGEQPSIPHPVLKPHTSCEPPRCPTRPAARLSAGETRQTLLLFVSLTESDSPRPGWRHGVLLVLLRDQSSSHVSAVTHDSGYIVGCWMLTLSTFSLCHQCITSITYLFIHLFVSFCTEYVFMYVCVYVCACALTCACMNMCTYMYSVCKLLLMYI